MLFKQIWEVPLVPHSHCATIVFFGMLSGYLFTQLVPPTSKVWSRTHSMFRWVFYSRRHQSMTVVMQSASILYRLQSPMQSSFLLYKCGLNQTVLSIISLQNHNDFTFLSRRIFCAQQKRCIIIFFCNVKKHGYKIIIVGNATFWVKKNIVKL